MFNEVRGNSFQQCDTLSVIIFVTVGSEVDHSCLPIAKVQNGGAIPPFSIGLHGMVRN
jgi:hypothetical protein